MCVKSQIINFSLIYTETDGQRKFEMGIPQSGGAPYIRGASYIRDKTVDKNPRTIVHERNVWRCTMVMMMNILSYNLRKYEIWEYLVAQWHRRTALSHFQRWPACWTSQCWQQFPAPCPLLLAETLPQHGPFLVFLRKHSFPWWWLTAVECLLPHQQLQRKWTLPNVTFGWQHPLVRTNKSTCRAQGWFH